MVANNVRKFSDIIFVGCVITLLPSAVLYMLERLIIIRTYIHIYIRTYIRTYIRAMIKCFYACLGKNGHPATTATRSNGICCGG